MFIVISLYIAYVGLNSLFADFIIRQISHSKYSLPLYHDEMLSTLITFCGFGVLLFKEKIKRKRIREFYIYSKNNTFNIKEFGSICGIKMSFEELHKLERIIKLDDIKLKTKRKCSLKYKIIKMFTK